MGAKITWDSPNNLGRLTEPPNLDGVVLLDVRKDIWSATVEDWENDLALRHRDFPLTYSGGTIDPATGAQEGAVFRVVPPWKIEVFDGTHELRINGALRAADGSRFWLPPATATNSVQIIAETPPDTPMFFPPDYQLDLDNIFASIWLNGSR